jgi:hypothetical protein
MLCYDYDLRGRVKFPIGGDVQHAAPAREPQGRRPVRSRRRRLQSGWEKIGEHSAWG